VRALGTIVDTVGAERAKILSALDFLIAGI
jgi:hypothetical protein